MATYYVSTSGNDSNAGTSEGAAFASLGKATGTATTSGDIIYVKSGTYTLTSSTNNVSGGRSTLTQGVKVEGYQTTPGDQAARPIINAGAITGITMISVPAAYNTRPCALINIEVDGNSGSSNKGVVVSSNYVANLYNCISRNCPGDGFTGASGGAITIDRCSAFGCANGFKDFKGATRCVSQGNSGSGFLSVDSTIFCRASGNAGIGFDYSTAIGYLAHNCVSHANGSHGYSASYDIGAIINSIATSNGGWGLSHSSANNGLTLVNFATRSNTSGAIQNAIVNAVNSIALSADPYTNAASNDFSLNNTSGGGALLRGLQRTCPGDSAISYLDAGAYQHQDSGGGSSGGVSLIGDGGLVY